MICIQKIYGFHGINRQNIEKSWYVTPVTNGRTEDGGRRKVENRAVFCWTRNRNKLRSTHTLMNKYWHQAKCWKSQSFYPLVQIFEHTSHDTTEQKSYAFKKLLEYLRLKILLMLLMLSGGREGKQSLSPRLFIALPALCTSNAKFAKNSLWNTNKQ